MTTPIQRYTENPIPGHPPCIVVDANGALCLWEDYQALAAANLTLTAEIGTLRTEMARLRDAQRWIPCSERMPDHAVWVVARYHTEFSTVYGDDQSITSIAKRLSLNQLSPVWKAFGHAGYHSEQSITHWMPLPAPPGQEKP